MPGPPVDRELNLLMQDILTFGSWGLALVLLAVAVRMSVRERTPFYALLVVATGVAAFAEPLYDEGMVLYFYSTDGMFTHFTAFDIPQPIWTHSGYIVLYATAALWVAYKIQRGGLTRASLFAFAGLELAMSCTFEIIGINGGAYEYWGPHTLRIFDYPLVIGVLEAAQATCFGVAAALLRQRVSSWVGLLGLFVVFPCTFFMVNFGAGAPVIIALHLEDTTEFVVGLGSVLSMIAAAALVRGAGLLLPAPADEPERTRHGSLAPAASS